MFLVYVHGGQTVANMRCSWPGWSSRGVGRKKGGKGATIRERGEKRGMADRPEITIQEKKGAKQYH
jgi:hypothetical protein